MSGDLLVFEEIKKLSESSNKKLTDVNIERLERNFDVLFVLSHNVNYHYPHTILQDYLHTCK